MEIETLIFFIAKHLNDNAITISPSCMTKWVYGAQDTPRLARLFLTFIKTFSNLQIRIAW